MPCGAKQLKVFTVATPSFGTLAGRRMSLRSPRISISREWRKIEALATFRIGNDSRVYFWIDPWLDNISLNSKFSRLSRIALLPKGSIFQHWDSQISSWAVYFRRLMKEGEVVDFQSLMICLNGRMLNSILDKKVWSLEPSGFFTVKLKGLKVVLRKRQF